MYCSEGVEGWYSFSSWMDGSYSCAVSSAIRVGGVTTSSSSDLDAALISDAGGGGYAFEEPVGEKRKKKIFFKLAQHQTYQYGCLNTDLALDIAHTECSQTILGDTDLR